jgi:hypothetical protein
MKHSLLLLALMMAGAAQAEVPIVVDPLEKKITVPIPKDTFFNRMAVISKETGVAIVIDREALARHGITQNQLVGGLPPRQRGIDLVRSFCTGIDTFPDGVAAIVILRQDDGSVLITAK